MLPILRIIPIGGVLLAILLLVLALDAPERIHTQWAPPLTPMRGPLISADEHPEWRQLLMRAAVRRADELARLRNLPDKPVLALPAKKFASLPAARIDADPELDDTTAVSAAAPAPATIPIDIGEASSVELPVVMPRERPSNVTLARPARHGHHLRAKPQPAPPFDLFKAMFGDPRMQQQLQQQQGQQLQQQGQQPQRPQQHGRRQQRRLPPQSQQSQQQQPAFGLPATAPTAAAQR